jgi:hypothetical protein
MADRRGANEYRRRTFGWRDRQIAFVCECKDDCRRSVLLTAAQFDEKVAACEAILVDPTHTPLPLAPGDGSSESARDDA